VSRSTERAVFTTEQRVVLLEQDASEAEAAVDQLRSELIQVAKDLRAEIAAVKQILTGMLVALATSALLLAANLLVGH